MQSYKFKTTYTNNELHQHVRRAGIPKTAHVLLLAAHTRICLEGILVGTFSCDCVAAKREKGALIATETLTEYLLSEGYYMFLLRKSYPFV